MPGMLYIPKELKNIKDRPKVYFCCHPEDFELCFEMLSKDIMSKQKCTIWYAENLLAPRDEEYLEDLRQMQLFLMPVTSNLLYTENIALSTEFSFAVENHIPVLPIMMENSLVDEFNKKCGDLQFLDKYADDATAISYDEKLTKFLETVLIGDETAQRVREAFDAYIFLSYRKKDRYKAQELMRLIHKNEFCRDLAIWYDEFLNIGEDFNENIAEALNKSQLFALAVTPNLINEDNYVQSTEYPLAVEAQKVIIPAEVVPTDREKLREQFDSVPEIIDTKIEGELSRAMMEALEKIAIKENDKSPEHNFLIGLAYLGGIDVEVDFDRAVELITSSAEAGLAEAADKLVDMYRNGVGVKRDYHTAIKWQEKKTAILEAEYKENPSEGLLDEIFWAIIYCGDFYKDLGKVDGAKNKYLQAMKCVQNHGYIDENKVLLRDLSVSYNRVGYTLLSQGDLQGAFGYYNKSLEIRAKHAVLADTIEVRRDLSLIYNNLGNICKYQGDLQGAYEYYTKSCKIAEIFASEADDVNDRRLLSTVYDNIGDVLREQGDLQGAIDYCTKSLCVRERVAAENHTITSFLDLSESYNNIGFILREQGDLQGAFCYYTKSLEIAKQIASISNSVDSVRLLMECHNNIGDVLNLQGKLQEAFGCYCKSKELAEQIVSKTDVMEYKRNLSVVYDNIGNVLSELGDLQQALCFYNKSLEIRVKIADRADTVEALRDLSVSYNHIGDMHRDNGDLQNALNYYNKSLEVTVKLATKVDTIESLRDLSVSYNNIGEVFEAQGDLQRALDYYEKSHTLIVQLVERTNSIEMRYDLSISCNRLGGILEALGNLQGALDCYIKSLSIREKILSETDTVRFRRALSISYERVGDIFSLQRDSQGALDYYTKSLELKESVATELNTAQSMDDLAVSYYKLAFAIPDRKCEFLLKALNIYRKLSSDYPDATRYRDVLAVVTKEFIKASL